MQQTLKNPLTVEGIGLHSGCKVKMTFLPAPANHGIVFCRTDLPGRPLIPALYTQVADTRNCTCLSDGKGAFVSTVEHLMAALRMVGVDNALLSAAELLCRELPRKGLRVLRKVSFADDKGNEVSLEPAADFSIRFEIEFPSRIVGHQVFDGKIDRDVFAAEIAPCRTFCEKYQVDYLQSIGLIKGGSLENAVVLDGETVLNPEGFRVADECVNHKVLDAIGDLYTSGYYIIGKLTANKTGHYHNNELLKKLFADRSNYELV